MYKLCTNIRPQILFLGFGMERMIALVAALSFSAPTFAETYTHNVYVHKAGVDPNIILQGQAQAQQQIAENNKRFNSILDGIVERHRQKKADERKAAFTSELIVATNGLQDVSIDTLSPLLKKYPDYSDQILQILQSKAK